MWNAASTEALLLSLRVASLATVAILLAGGPLAFWLGRRKRLGPLTCWIEPLLSLPLVIPPVVMGYVLLMALGPASPVGRWLEAIGLRFALDWKGAVLASGVLAFPLFLAVARVAFSHCDRRLEEAARTLNAGPLRVFLTVTLPPAVPGLAAASVLAFARAFGEFGATMMLAGNIAGQTRTVPQAIWSYFQAGREAPAWGLAAVSVAVGAAAMAASLVLVRGRAAPGEEGGRA
ncbi:MAG TPA: molybdate ABC transporter permease subunit [Phycisphaerae bacterium]|nr:molybdate ABC transporter permease subunit [Phycisphaerae bacterium]